MAAERAEVLLASIVPLLLVSSGGFAESPFPTFVDSGARLGDSSSHGVAVADVDGDGDPDLAFANYKAASALYLNQANGSDRFATASQHFPEARSLAVKFADFDGDDDPDLLFVNDGADASNFSGLPSVPCTIWWNDGRGTFIESDTRLGVDAWAQDAAVADVDGDGDLDIYVVNFKPYLSFLWINAGKRQGLREGTFLGHVIEGPSGPARSVALGDLDGDGDPDAFEAIGGARSNIVRMNMGHFSGEFEATGQRIGDKIGSVGVVLTDVNGDTHLDAVVCEDQQFVENLIYINDGEGRFENNGYVFGIKSNSDIAAGDLDGDGDPDLVVTNMQDGFQVFENIGTFSGIFGLVQNEELPAGAFDVELADLNADGRLDIVLAMRGPNRVYLSVPAVGNEE